MLQKSFVRHVANFLTADRLRCLGKTCTCEIWFRIIFKVPLILCMDACTHTCYTHTQQAGPPDLLGPAYPPIFVDLCCVKLKLQFCTQPVSTCQKAHRHCFGIRAVLMTLAPCDLTESSSETWQDFAYASQHMQWLLAL